MTTLGQQLLQARRKRGLNLQDVAHKTRIPVPRLQDLEADNYNTHGGLIYAKSFLRTYAAYLQVDASAILDLLQPPPLAGKKDYRYLVRNLGPWIRARQFRSLAPRRPTASQGGSLLSMSMIVGAIVLLGSSLMFANAMFNFGPAEAKESAAAESRVTPTALPPVSTKDISQASWSSSPTSNEAVIFAPTAKPAASHEVPVAIPVDASGQPVKPLPAPVKAVPVND